MSEEFEKNGSNDRNNDSDLFSKAVRAGKRTYFFDVKSTRGNDYYLTITESKKRFGQDGKFFYEKHKILMLVHLLHLIEEKSFLLSSYFHQ